MGMYVMVVWTNGTPAPDGSTLKNVHEPDVAKIGGRVLYKSESRRVITIPLAAAKGLRHDPAVVYLQRLWMGESLAGWDERYTSESSFRPSASTSADTDIVWGPKDYAYDGSGNIKSIGTDQYVYDSAGRLIQSTVSGKTESFKYDSFGNLIEKQVNGAYTQTIAVDGASNRLTGVQYDAAGNSLTVDQSRRWYQFDSLSALAYVEQPPQLERRILYDASDERIGMMSGTLSRWTIRDFAGHMIREFKGDGTYWIWDEDNFYGEGSLLAGETQEWGYTGTFRHDGPRHYHLDHLGSVRVVTNSLGRSISEHDYDPFGTNMTPIYQEPINWNDPHIDSMRFAGHSRDFLGMLNADNTDYIDYMHARHYDPNLGRFLSVDVHPADAVRPQSWNRYAYAQNDPVSRIDPDGQKDIKITFRHFIQQQHVFSPFGNVRGDDRGFSLSRNASYRTSLTVRVDSKTGHMTQFPDTGISHNFTMGVTRKAAENSWSNHNYATSSKDASGNVVIKATTYASEPFPNTLLGPLTPPITSHTEVVISPDGNVISITGSRTSSPSMEINISSDGDTYSAYRGDENALFITGLFTFTPFQSDCINHACEQHEERTRDHDVEIEP